jgi:hypothetical protein
MTDEEKENERIRALALSCYRAWTHITNDTRHLEQCVTRNWDNLAFQAYMRDMGLTTQLEQFNKIKSA